MKKKCASYFSFRKKSTPEYGIKLSDFVNIEDKRNRLFTSFVNEVWYVLRWFLAPHPHIPFAIRQLPDDALPFEGTFRGYGIDRGKKAL